MTFKAKTKLQTIATPTVEIMAYAAALNEFGGQVPTREYDSQRNHVARSEVPHKIRHLTSGAQPTQAIISVVKFKRRAKRLLVDGYHRFTQWMKDGCPFETLIVIVYEVASDAEVEAIFKSIDSRKAVKSNADFFTSALNCAGIKKPQSNAYAVGTNASSFFKREGVIGDPNKPIAEMAKSIKENMSTHILMDMLFRNMENLGKSKSKDLFHTGVALAVYRTLQNLNETVRGAALAELKNALLLAGGLDIPKTKTSVALHTMLTTEFAKTALLLRGQMSNKEKWYDACAAYLQPQFEKLLAPALKAVARKAATQKGSKRKTA